jgi:hypothetical protein
MLAPDRSLEFVLEPSDEVVEGRLYPKFLIDCEALQQQPFDGGDGQVRQGCGAFRLEASLLKSTRESCDPIRDQVLEECLKALRVNQGITPQLEDGSQHRLEGRLGESLPECLEHLQRTRALLEELIGECQKLCFDAFNDLGKQCFFAAEVVDQHSGARADAIGQWAQGQVTKTVLEGVLRGFLEQVLFELNVLALSHETIVTCNECFVKIRMIRAAVTKLQAPTCHTRAMNLRAWLITAPIIATIATSTVTGPIRAQTAVELLTVTSISSTLDSSISVPAGTSFVKNPKYAQEFAGQLGAEANQYTGFELYVAKGIATRLADSFVIQLETNFAAAGYFKSGSSSQTVGGEVRTKSMFDDGAGKQMLMYVVKRTDGVYFLVAKKK